MDPYGDVAALFDLTGKTALVTGASSGLGSTLAVALAGAGARVLACGRDERALAAVAARDGRITPVVADLQQEEGIARIDRAIREAGGIDVLVNNAGAIAAVRAAENETPEQIDATLGLNLVAPLRLAQLALPHMKERGGGSIISITSISGLVGIGRIPQASYAASKAGLLGLSRELALQWSRHGIRVNTIACGFFESSMTGSLFAHEELAAWVAEQTPLPIRAQPSDFVGTALLLASRAGRYITGQTLVVDGGWTAR